MRRSAFVRSGALALLVAACTERSVPLPPAASTTPPAAAVVTVEPPSTWIDLGHLSDEHFSPRRVRLWCPSGAHDPPWPVLVVLDGQEAERWFRLPGAIEALARDDGVRPWAVVAIDGTRERDEELEATDGRFVSFVADVVLPAARARAPLSSRPEETAMFGYSLAGLQAVLAVTERRDTFGRAVAMSPSLWVGDRAAIRAFERSDATLPQRLWIDSGTAEVPAAGFVSYPIRDARALRDAGLARGMTFGRELGYLEVVGETHEMTAAGRRMHEALYFALGEVDLATPVPRTLSLARLSPVGRRSAFTILAEYEHGARLTWPASLTSMWSGDLPLTRDVAALDRPLRVRALGLEARCE